MSDPSAVVEGSVPPPTGQSGSVSRSSVVRRLTRSPVAVAAVLLLGVVAAIALLAGVLAPYDPNFANLTSVLTPPGGEHLLGTDSAGRDVLSRLFFGARITLLSAALAAGVAIVIGLPSGLVAGYYGGRFDGVASWSTNILLALPSMIVLLAVRAALGPSVWIAMIVFGVLLSPGYFRLTRTAVQSVRNELYVDAARVAGLSDARIIARHILSVVRAPIIIQTAMVCGIAISIQSALEFLGLGDPTVPTWGVMVNDGFRNIYRAPMTLIWPTITIAAVIAAFVLFGNSLRDALEDQVKVKEKRQARAARVAEQDTRRRAAVQADAASSALPENASTTHLLEVRGLSIAYPQPDGSRKHVVDGMSYHLDRGEVLGIVGESGSGKSQTRLRRPRPAAGQRDHHQRLDPLRRSVHRGRGR